MALSSPICLHLLLNHSQLLPPLMLAHCSIILDKAPGHKLFHSQFQLNSCLFAGVLFGDLPVSFVPT